MVAIERAPTRAAPLAQYGLVGESSQMRDVLVRLDACARVRRTTLITGPTGTGKEMVARALHDRGQPPSRPFVVVHCGALPDSLVEDELFGHTRGAFTGARDARAGLVRAAAGGTLFLDEVDSLSPKVQANLLRFLESGEFRSVGSDRVERIQAWVIAATNHDLGEGVKRGEFRADLLYRLEVMRIALPPLRVRGDDVELLAHHFLRETVGPGHDFTPRALAALRAHAWPGNVRELKHTVERAALLAERDVLDVEDLGLASDVAGPPPDAPPPARDLADDLWDLIARDGLSLAEAVTHCERAIIDAALRAEDGNRARAAERLSIHVRTIFKKLHQP
jgi:two-component system, NtrC family, response regulator AtoC